MWPMSARQSADRPRLVLASGSPRRRELLASVGVTAEVLVTNIDETPLAAELATELVSRLAAGKAEAAAVILRSRETDFAGGCLVIGSDTVVEIDGDILGKPVDDGDAAATLRRLSGRTHRAHTGVGVVHIDNDGTNTEVVVVTTSVTMRELSNEDISWYLATGDHMGKAGSYAIQGFAAPFISGVDGAYDAVVGLPLHYVDRLLTEFGWPLRRFSE